MQHGTRKFDAVTTAGGDRLDLAPSCSILAERSQWTKRRHISTPAACSRQNEERVLRTELPATPAKRKRTFSAIWGQLPVSHLPCEPSTDQARQRIKHRQRISQAQDSGSSTGGATRSNAPANASHLRDLATYKHKPHQHHTQEQERTCLLDSLAGVVLSNYQKVLCHDDWVWSEVRIAS